MATVMAHARYLSLLGAHTSSAAQASHQVLGDVVSAACGCCAIIYFAFVPRLQRRFGLLTVGCATQVGLVFTVLLSNLTDAGRSLLRVDVVDCYNPTTGVFGWFRMTRALPVTLYMVFVGGLIGNFG